MPETATVTAGADPSACPTAARSGLAERAADRLTVLRHELQLGEARLRELEAEQAQLQQTLLRISGAAQVLEELMSGGEPAGS